MLIVPGGIGLGRRRMASDIPFEGFPWASDSNSAWDFTTDEVVYDGVFLAEVSNTPGWSFARSSSGYATTLAGTLQQFSSGQLRRTDRGALMENGATNLVLRSQEFDNASWIKNETTITANSIMALDGTMTADLMTDDGGGFSTVFQGVTINSDALHTWSRFVKKGNEDWVKFWIGNGGDQLHAWFNLDSGIGGTTDQDGAASDMSINIEPFANGWYRCSVTGRINVGTASIDFHTLNTDNDNSTTRVTGATRYEWGAQLEAGVFASSYIPTTSSSENRDFDLLTASLSENYPLTVYVELERTVATESGNNQYVLRVDDTSNDNATTMYIGDDGVPRYLVASGSVQQANEATGAGLSHGPAEIVKLAIRVATDDFNAAQNGVASSADTSGDVPSQPSRIAFGHPAGSSPLNGYFRRVAIFDHGLDDAELEAITS